MHIVLPGALPDPEVAADLAPHLTQHAPTLAHWFLYATAQLTASRAADTWCTPLEHWLLRARGFEPAQSEHISAGLGPMRATSGNDEPVWLAELIHMSPSRDGAALLTADTLDITGAQSDALLATAQELAQEDGIALSRETATTWRVRSPCLSGLACASPALVATSAVNDWWPQEAIARPWRRLVNTLQMAWFEHPVNQERAAQGLAPLNSLWLYGGARPRQLTRSLPTDLHLESALQDCATRQDWGGWIQALAQLEQTCFVPLARTAPVLVLTGRDRYATLTVPQHWWQRLKARDWRSWWCNR
ncbi:Phosphoglycerate mutase OS=Castellaniella defragrans OX=75697 GN=HNR28_000279 PE=4 SV=1 [Castellaniella defragrans]